jgi:hypothetical protein
MKCPIRKFEVLGPTTNPVSGKVLYRQDEAGVKTVVMGPRLVAAMLAASKE